MRFWLVLVPQSWLDSQIEGAVGQAYAWLDTADPYPTIRFDMQPVKLHMLDAGVQAALERIVDSWPPCTGEDLAVFAGNLLGGSPEMVYCSPPGALRDLVLGFLLAGFKEAVRTMPAEMVLTPGSRQPQEMQELKDTLLTWRGLGQWGWMVPVLLLLAILGLQVRSLAAWGRWWGWPLLAAGILALALVVAGASLLQLWGERLVASPILRPVATWIRALLADVSGEILARQLTGGLVLVDSWARRCCRWCGSFGGALPGDRASHLRRPRPPGRAQLACSARLELRELPWKTKRPAVRRPLLCWLWRSAYKNRNSCACCSSSSRKAGWAISMRAAALCRMVLPYRQATPNSVTM